MDHSNVSVGDVQTRIAEALRNCEEGSGLAKVIERHHEKRPVLRRNGQYRLEGFINLFQELQELLAAADPRLEAPCRHNASTRKILPGSSDYRPTHLPTKLESHVTSLGRKPGIWTWPSSSNVVRNNNDPTRKYRKAWRTEHPNDTRVKSQAITEGSMAAALW